jgi:hypothetical protein
MNDKPQPDSGAVGTAKALTSALDGLRVQLAQATRYGHRNRRMIWWLVVSLVLDVALTIAIAVLAVETRSANDKAAQVHTQQVATCLAGNQSRAAQIQLWDYILSLTPSTPLTQEQKRQLADLRGYVHKVFAARDCSRV